MDKNKFLLALFLAVGLLVESAACAQADTVGYDWNDKLGRGVLNMVGSPVELARTIHVQSNAEGPAYGWTMGIVEGLGKGLIRFGAGAIDMLTCPFNFPKADKVPLLMPVYPWDEWDGQSV